MKLYNVLYAFDVFIVAESPEEAREAIITWIAEGNPPNETVTVEVTRENAIRPSWQAKRPLVAGDVSDADFERLKGKTVPEAYAMIYKKEPVK